MRLITDKTIFQGQEYGSIKGYYATVHALTPKEQTQVEPAVSSSTSPFAFLFSPLMIYAVSVLFVVFFVGALILQAVHKSLDLRRTIMTLVVALLLASTPLTLRTALQVNTLESKAAPDEVPRNVEIIQTSEDTILVSWETQTQKLGTLRVGEAPLAMDKSRIIIGNNGSKTSLHKIAVGGLFKGKEYEIEILSGKNWYDNSGEPLKIRYGNLQ